jgi:CheY-like chemotaxis protein
MVSHELRTPLNAIMGWSKVLANPHFDDNRRAGAMATIERNAVAMAQLIEDLLDMSRVITGKMRLSLQRVDVAQVTESAVQSLAPQAQARGVHLGTETEPGLPSVVGDPTRLQQIIWNLVSNAVKFTPQGGSVRIGLRNSDGALEIVGQDTGKGIAADFLTRVFDAFRQEEVTSSRSRGGLGLGLAITRQLVELHGGTISVASEGEGRGATFTVRLPLSSSIPSSPPQGADHARQFRAEASYERPPQLNGLKVLVVDDDDDARGLTASILEDCGCIVTRAVSGREALERLRENPPDVLLSDVAMPEIDGIDLVRKIRQLPREQGGDIPAAALTAYARAEDRLRLLNAGFSIHLPKPIEPAELVAVVLTLTRFIHRVA